jgi:predicted protein tyrosine phosphatase
MDEGHDSDDEDYLFRPSEILPGKLYLSCCSIAGKEDLMKIYGITGIVSMGGFSQHVTYTVHKNPMKYLFVFIDDHEDEPIDDHFEECIQFIKDTDGPVLVHCMAGISRSATIVIAYLMKERVMSLEDAYVHVKERRSIVKPNSGFMRRLRGYELSLKK